MRRIFARSTQALIDAGALALALWLAFLIRFDWDLPLQMLKRVAFTWPYVVAFQYLALVGFGVPRFAWRYVGLRETQRIFFATAGASGVLLAVRLLAGALVESFGHAQYALLPIGVILIDFILAFLGVTGVRVLRRLLAERAESVSRRAIDRAETATMLIGAGQAGLLVAKELSVRPDLGMRPVGFLDDDPVKVGSVIHGIPVLGTTANLEAHCRKHGAQEVLITIANAPGSQVRRIKELCDRAGLPAKIIPGIYEIVGGQVNLSRIRNVSIEDLLGREPVVLETDSIAEEIRGRSVLVTGAGGSIGSELCRQVCRFQPSRLVLVEQAENALFHIHRELVADFPGLGAAITPCIADICDLRRIEAIFIAHRPEVVLHAAAHKHVPMMEWNPGEAIKNNVFGTKALADLSSARGVRQFVMISTDKAVNPTSVMGASKRTAEIYVQALSPRSETRFVTVRFGNVLGSAGSVIPIFQEQIARGGPVTVTHPEMKRYFMTIPEACQLVLQAGAMGKGGEIFILEMGEPVKILDLARDLIRLSGFQPDEDIQIELTGIRPGEKLFEELSVAEEVAEKTRHPKIFIGKIRANDLQAVSVKLSELQRLCDGGTPEQVRSKFQEIVPEYQPAVPEPPPPRSPTPEEVAAPARAAVAGAR
ncbi:MAG: polysaccharide biosynthesis protein [Myxococcales bacterium]|nr:polysaccharide biosynthesis protein [Myxococcales bacterium]